MTDTSVVFNVIGRDTGVGTVLNKVKGLFKSTGAEGAASMKLVDHEVVKLNADLNDAQGNLRQLAREFAKAGTAAEKAKISAAMNREQSNINKITKAKNLIDVKDVPKEAESIGTQLANGIRSKMQELGPLQQALIPAAAELAPLLGATIGAAVVGAAGIGGVAGGIIIASKDPAVQSAAASLKKVVGDQLTQAAQPFVPATLDAITNVQEAFRSRIAPTLKQVFASSAGYVKPLTDGILGLIENVSVGFARAAAAAGPVISVISNELPALGKEIGDIFSESADNAEGSAAALQTVFGVVNDSIHSVGQLVSVLGDVYSVVHSIEDEFPQLGGAVKAALNPMGDLIGNVIDAGGATGTFRAVVKATGDTATETAGDITDLRKAVDDYTDSNLSAYDAQIKAKQALVDSTAAIKKNGAEIDLNTQKGRDNRSQLVTLAQAFNTVTTANDKAGVSAGAANKTFEQQRAKFVAVAQAAGYSKTAANNLATAILHIPASRSVNISASTGTASARVQHVVNLLNAVRSKQVSVSVLVADSQLNKVQNTLNRLGARAGGGPISKGSPYIVGEQGPEMIVPDANGTVLSATKTNALVAAGAQSGSPVAMSGGAGRAQTLTLNVAGERRVAELVRYLIRTYNLIDGAVG